MLRVEGGAKQQRGRRRFADEVSLPLPSIRKDSKVLPCGDVLPGTAKRSVKSSRPSGEIRFCEGEVSLGNVTVEPGIGVRLPSPSIRKPVMLGTASLGKVGPDGGTKYESPRLDTYRWSPERARLSGCSPPESKAPIRRRAPPSMRKALAELLPWLTAKRKRPSGVASTSVLE